MPLDTFAIRCVFPSSLSLTTPHLLGIHTKILGFLFSHRHNTQPVTSQVLDLLSFNKLPPVTHPHHHCQSPHIDRIHNSQKPQCQGSHFPNITNYFFSNSPLQLVKSKPSHPWLPPLSDDYQPPFFFQPLPFKVFLGSIFPPCPPTSFCELLLTGKSTFWVSFTLPSLHQPQAAPSCCYRAANKADELHFEPSS